MIDLLVLHFDNHNGIFLLFFSRLLKMKYFEFKIFDQIFIESVFLLYYFIWIFYTL